MLEWRCVGYTYDAVSEEGRMVVSGLLFTLANRFSLDCYPSYRNGWQNWREDTITQGMRRCVTTVAMREI